MNAVSAALKLNGVDVVLANDTKLVPVATILPSASFLTPSGYLLCDGSAVSRTTYSTLFNMMSLAQNCTTVLGSNSVTVITTVNLSVGMQVTSSNFAPSTILSIVNSNTITISNNAGGAGTVLGRFTIFGYGDASTTFNLPDLRGQVPIGDGTGSYSGATLHNVGTALGEETHQLTTTEMPSHTHPPLSPATNFWGSGSGSTTTTGAVARASPATTGSTGGDGAHNNMQPSLVVRYIIKT